MEAKMYRKPALKISLTLIILTLSGLAAVYGVFHSSSGPGVDPKRLSFELKDFDGKVFKSDDSLGTPMVVHFWAAWCAPCAEEIPQFIANAQQNQDNKLQWVAVSGDHSWKELHELFPESKKVPGLFSLMDESAKVAEAFGTFQFPETYLLDARHHVLEKWVGPQDWKSLGKTIVKKIQSE